MALGENMASSEALLRNVSLPKYVTESQVGLHFPWEGGAHMESDTQNVYSIQCAGSPARSQGNFINPISVVYHSEMSSEKIPVLPYQSLSSPFPTIASTLSHTSSTTTQSSEKSGISAVSAISAVSDPIPAPPESSGLMVRDLEIDHTLPEAVPALHEVPEESEVINSETKEATTK